MSHSVTAKSVAIKSVTALMRAVDRLKNQGVNISLERNAVPRNYYQNQIARQIANRAGHGLRLHDNPEEHDYVVRVHDAYYDVGFIYNEQGELVPLFDPYPNPSYINPETGKGSGPISKFLGTSGVVGEDASSAHIGMLLQAYSAEAVLEQCESQGIYGAQITTDSEGNLHIEIEA